ncbi:TOMT methyltransferase, partial [Ramphastos sulfuratus]|nr:TOMT methyltransferase [Ramphastos sulfuratus]
LSGVPREQRAFQFVLAHAVPGDPRHVLQTFDRWCQQREHLSCVGPVKGQPRALPPLCAKGAAGRGGGGGDSCGMPGMVGASPLGSAVPCGVAEPHPERCPVPGARCPAQVELLVGPSEAALRRLRQQHQLLQIDFVFMAHGKSCYLRDLRLLESQRLLAPGATVLADNVLCPGAPRFLRYARSCGRYRCRLHRASLQY